MTTESARESYLRTVLSIDPAERADAIVRLRAQFLAGGDLDPSLHDETHDALDRSIELQSLATCRSEFWTSETIALNEHLKALSQSKFPEVAATASRLQRVADARPQFAKMAVDESIHHAFREALRNIMVAPPAVANRLREEQFAHIRPDRNPGYHVAGKTIKEAIRQIQAKYPQIYEIEKSWFGELFHYQPRWDLPDEDAETSRGYGLLVLVFAILVAAFMIVKQIFDLGD